MRATPNPYVADAEFAVPLAVAVHGVVANLPTRTRHAISRGLARRTAYFAQMAAVTRLGAHLAGTDDPRDARALLRELDALRETVAALARR